jgi:GntR family transcriptional regulator
MSTVRSYPEDEAAGQAAVVVVPPPAAGIDQPADGREATGARLALGGRRIDRSSPVPFYYQLRQIVEDAITGSDTRAGDALPSEAALGETFGVSRTVVRQALSDLERDGLIERFKGRGSFVAEQKVPERLVQALTSLHEDVAARGQTLATRVFRFETQPASAYAAGMLGLEPGEEIVLLERLRIVDGQPFEISTTHLPYVLCAPILGLDMTQRSLYHALEHDLGLKLTRGRRSVEAAQADAQTARHLGLREGAPVLLLKGTTYLDDGRAIEYFTSVHRGDRSRFEVDLVRPPRDRRG